MQRFALACILFAACPAPPQQEAAAPAQPAPVAAQLYAGLSVSDWLRVLGDASPDHRAVHAQRLADIGNAGIPVILAGLTSGHPDTAKGSALAVCRFEADPIGSPAEPLVVPLIAMLDSPDLGSAMLAARALGRIGPVAADAIPAIKHQASRFSFIHQEVLQVAILDIERALR